MWSADRAPEQLRQEKSDVATTVESSKIGMQNRPKVSKQPAPSKAEDQNQSKLGKQSRIDQYRPKLSKSNNLVSDYLEKCYSRETNEREDKEHDNESGRRMTFGKTAPTQ